MKRERIKGILENCSKRIGPLFLGNFIFSSFEMEILLHGRRKRVGHLLRGRAVRNAFPLFSSRKLLSTSDIYNRIAKGLAVSANPVC